MGQINVITDLPLCLVEDNGKYLRILYGNEPFMKQMRSLHVRNLEQLELKINSPLFSHFTYLRNVADSMESVNQLADKYLPFENRYFHLHVQVVSNYKNTFVYACNIYDVTHEEDEKETNHITDSVLRGSLTLYHWVTQVNLKDDDLYCIFNDTVKDAQYKHTRGIRRYFENERDTVVYPEDWDRYTDFYDFDTLMLRLYQNGGKLINYFRRKTRQGTFVWEEHVLLALHTDREEAQFLVLIKDTDFEREDIQQLLVETNAKKNPYSIVSDGVMWRNFQLQTSIKFFWKDRQRRFLGASNSFLQYYHITRKDLIGKTDEDMNWHVDDEPFKNDEEDVIEKGVVITNAVGSCVIRGVLHNIIATKMPLYSGGRIIGLMGYFEDADDRKKVEDKKAALMATDSLTGVMSTYATIASAVKYVENAMYRKIPFASIRITTMGFQSFYNIYGREEGIVLLKKIADTLHGALPIGYVIGRLEGATFCAIGRYQDRTEVEKVFSDMQKAIWQIHESNGYLCTLTASGRIRYAEDYDDPREIFQDW
ncbi:MAG: PAS domain-containing protein [Lachnospiraceae bacterium]|nr:PAS domain-containing protein [Lachnospiraceae bacterium]